MARVNQSTSITEPKWYITEIHCDFKNRILRTQAIDFTKGTCPVVSELNYFRREALKSEPLHFIRK
jgi:hypothetical protein